MYKNKKLTKAKSAILKGVFSLFLCIIFSNLSAQTWQLNISKDYEFSIQDIWGENDVYEAKFVLFNNKTAFVKKVVIAADNIGKLVFPDEFTQTRGKFNKDTITHFNWYIEVKKKKIFEGELDYNPSPNTILQLSKYDIIDRKLNEKIWGRIIDSYTWEDKKGENIFIRSKLFDKKTNSMHLYFYHFRVDSENYLLVRKFTDYVKYCDEDILAKNKIESIELTDINKDTVAEISFLYNVGCSCINDSLPIKTKLILTTDGNKYAIRGIMSQRQKTVIKEYKIGDNLKKEPLFNRFLEKKWKREAGEKETIYN